MAIKDRVALKEESDISFASQKPGGIIALDHRNYNDNQNDSGLNLAEVKQQVIESPVLINGELLTGQQQSATANAFTRVDYLNSLLNNKADKSILLISVDQQVLVVSNPSLGDDVTLDIKTNVPDGLAKLDATGFLPSSLINQSGREYLGGYDPQLGLPNDALNRGDYWLISADGDLMLVPDSSITVPTSMPVTVGDVIYYESTGIWVYQAARNVTLAIAVTYDNLVSALISENVQDAITELKALFDVADIDISDKISKSDPDAQTMTSELIINGGLAHITLHTTATNNASFRLVDTNDVIRVELLRVDNIASLFRWADDTGSNVGQLFFDDNGNLRNDKGNIISSATMICQNLKVLDEQLLIGDANVSWRSGLPHATIGTLAGGAVTLGFEITGTNGSYLFSNIRRGTGGNLVRIAEGFAMVTRYYTRGSGSTAGRFEELITTTREDAGIAASFVTARQIFADGGTVFGEASGGSQGLGTINAKKLFAESALSVGAAIYSWAEDYKTISVGDDVDGGSSFSFSPGNNAAMYLTTNLYRHADGSFRHKVQGHGFLIRHYIIGNSRGQIQEYVTLNQGAPDEVATLSLIKTVYPMGGTNLGEATGSDRGFGTLNCQGLFVHGSPAVVLNDLGLINDDLINFDGKITQFVKKYIGENNEQITTLHNKVEHLAQTVTDLTHLVDELQDHIRQHCEII